MAMNDDRRSPRGQRRNLAVLVILVVGVALVFGVAVARYALMPTRATADVPTGATTLPTASPFATATPLGPGGTLNAGGGTVLTAATPTTVAIIPGYQRPDADNATQQQLRAQIGNPNKVIIISVDGQYIQAWQGGKLVKWSYVTTGKPESPTPTGFFKVGYKLSPYTFTSGAPPNSAGWYYPTKGVFALFFADGGYFIHDAWWRTVYGPGLTTWHYDADRQEYQTGSHGCVNTPIETMGWLFVWADVGTDIIIY